MSKLHVKLRVDFDRDHAIGPGKIALLEKMRDCGSLSQAARNLDMSYRRAWQLLDSLNRSFKEPLVSTAVGGAGGGGSTLTALGEAVINAYRTFEKDVNGRAGKHFAALARAVSPASAAGPRTMAKAPGARGARRTKS